MAPGANRARLTGEWPRSPYRPAETNHSAAVTPRDTHDAPPPVPSIDGVPSPKYGFFEVSLCLPPYSPDFNPIEMAFAKLKALLHKAAERTIDDLRAAFSRITDFDSPEECEKNFSTTGYDAA